MNSFENDVIDLGAATTETRGLANNGSPDTQQGAKYAFGGIEVED